MENYLLGEIYRPGFPGLKKAFFIHEQLMKCLLPSLYNHFQAQGIQPSAYLAKVPKLAKLLSSNDSELAYHPLTGSWGDANSTVVFITVQKSTLWSVHVGVGLRVL